MRVRGWSLCVMKLIVDQILSYSWGIPYSQRCFILVFLTVHLKAIVPSRVDLLLVLSSLPEILAYATCYSVSNFINTLVNTHMHYIDIIDFIRMCLCSQQFPGFLRMHVMMKLVRHLVHSLLVHFHICKPVYGISTSGGLCGTQCQVS